MKTFSHAFAVWVAMVATASAANASPQNHSRCHLQGTVGFSFSLFPKSEHGAVATHEPALHPLFDGDVGAEVECHVSQRLSLVVEFALGMNTKPQTQVPLTVGLVYSLTDRVGVGLAAIAVFHPHPDDRARPFGGGLGGLILQLRLSEDIENRIVIGPAFELEQMKVGGAEHLKTVPGFSIFSGFAFR